MSFETFSYRQLDAYHKAKEFVIYVYALLKQFPKEEQYALCDQLRRAAISIPSNIAEGMGRMSVKEQIHFIEIAFGSLNETMCQLELAYELNYISQEDLLASEDFTKDITRMLSRLRKIRLDKLTVARQH
ncbi:MAG: four helix bundle protein [Bacteroidaceae bacterium]|nr:four helix bundle protein [Bacteroidaceae bacterium]